jgi:hypothetical protein
MKTTVRWFSTVPHGIRTLSRIASRPIFSRPCGTFQSRILTQDCVLAKFSGPPFDKLRAGSTGLDFMMGVLTQTL